MKKFIAILTIIMVFILPFSVTFNEQKAHANIISKPLTITAKKVAKELAQNSAVEMAEHILFEKAMSDFLATDMTDPGYKAVCLDGAKSYNDCPANKRAQVKETLTSTDKTTLKNKVEQVLEQKTNTSSKWTKFLDWFVPIFLISGLVATFESMIDGDSQSLIDDIAQEALLETGLLKGLSSGETGGELGRYTDFIQSLSLNTYSSVASRQEFILDIVLKPNTAITFTFTNHVGNKINRTFENNVQIGYYQDITTSNSNGQYTAYLKPSQTFLNGKSTTYNFKSANTPVLFTSSPRTDVIEARNEVKAMSTSLYTPMFSSPNIDYVMTNFIAAINGYASGDLEVSGLKKYVPEVITDYGNQPGLEHIKNPDGTVTTPGINSFKYTHGSNEIYPAPDSTTGWKDKTTGIDIAVVEDEVVVDGGEPPIDPEAPPAEDDDINTDKDKDKIKKKSRDWSALLTTRFPFSLPWDFLHLMKFLYASPMTPHWEIKGTEKIPFNLKIDLKFMEPYAPWFRTFIFLSFVMSVIFLHGRFMGGSK